MEEKQTTLYIEDEFISAAYVKTLLSDEYNVLVARSGKEGIELAESKKVDIFFVDINLGGGMTGVDVLKKLKSTDKYCHKPFLAITAYAAESDKQGFLSNGFTHFLPKPYLKKDIFRILADINSN